MTVSTQEVAVIAGVGPGLGASLARKFAREGCAIALLARSADFLNILAEELRQLGPSYCNGIIVTQVVPQTDSASTAVIRAREALAKYFPGDAFDLGEPVQS